MADVRVLVLRAAGVNCEVETAHAWGLAGASADIVHINALRDAPQQLQAYHVLTIPGGFSYGDDIAAGRILAIQVERFLGDALAAFVERGGLILGICNGFQVLCKAGLLPGPALPRVSITHNVSGRYEDRWVELEAANGPCCYLTPGRRYRLPVAHGEGRVVLRDDADLAALESAGCVALRYGSSSGPPAGYPANPNGSTGDIAGLCDPTGRIFGLMPHPERFVDTTQHPEWTRGDVTRTDGLDLFETAIQSTESPTNLRPSLGNGDR